MFFASDLTHPNMLLALPRQGRQGRDLAHRDLVRHPLDEAASLTAPRYHLFTTDVVNNFGRASFEVTVKFDRGRSRHWAIRVQEVGPRFFDTHHLQVVTSPRS